ncbi:MAG: hypothetical protein POG74_01640 [Acidocella sp.]|nr:hypothetical protein [Acidocella sp.]
MKPTDAIEWDLSNDEWVGRVKMAGVRINKDGAVYGLQGLFAAGEASCRHLRGMLRRKMAFGAVHHLLPKFLKPAE